MRNSKSRAAGALAAATLALVATSSCGSTCATDCPPIIFYLEAPPGENLDVMSAPLTGPACPAPQLISCDRDPVTGLACVQLTIVATQPGTCRVDLTFNDGRAPFTTTAEFGPETHQGCCHGLPVLGANVVTIPPLHGPPADAGADSGVAADASSDGEDAGPPDARPGSPDASSPTDSNNGAA